MHYFCVQKYASFWDIRQQYFNEVNMLAKQRLDKQKASEKQGAAAAGADLQNQTKPVSVEIYDIVTC